MGKGIAKTLILIGSLLANYFFVLSIILSSETWIQVMAYIVGAILNLAIGMIINEVK